MIEFLEEVKLVIQHRQALGICPAVNCVKFRLGVGCDGWTAEPLKRMVLSKMKESRVRIEAITKFGADQYDVANDWFWWYKGDNEQRLAFLDWLIEDFKQEGVKDGIDRKGKKSISFI